MATGGEDGLIARHFAPLAGPGGLGLLDDVALVQPPAGCDLVLTTDALVAGVHFFPDDPPASIGRKALGVNLSDLAAKGADPLGYLLSLALPEGWTEDWLAGFCRGLDQAGGRAGCALLGGDTVVTPGPLTISITALGSVPSDGAVRRTSASRGELICITGTIGDAALGLALSAPGCPQWASNLSEADQAFLIDRYRHPQPRMGMAEILRNSATAAMDVSDGLTGDLAKLLRVSHVGGEIDLDEVPFSPAGRTVIASDPALRDRMISGGDDYEILFTIRPEHREQVLSIDIPVTVIGRTTKSLGLRAFEAGQLHPLVPGSYSHI